MIRLTDSNRINYVNISVHILICGGESGIILMQLFPTT